MARRKGKRGLEGINEVSRNLHKALDGYKRASEGALRGGAEIIKGEAVRRAPRRTGNLKNSARVFKLRSFGNKTKVRIAFIANYAVYVHENVGAHFKEGQAKFLEGAVKAKLRDVRAYIKKAVGR